MTTIAWDGKTLAADRQTTAGGTPTPTTKVFTATGPDGSRWVYGIAGLTGECQEFVRCVEADRRMPSFKDLHIMAVNDAGQVWVATESLMWAQMQVNRWAIGSGAEYALGAMAAGMSAYRAVEIASALDVNTGLGIDVIGF